jgi:uncharacterized protein YkwD
MSKFNRKIIITTSIAILIFFALSFLFKDSSDPSISSETEKRDEIVRNEAVNQEVEGKTREFQGAENDFINLINNSRYEHGLPPIVLNEKLSQSAMAKAREMEEQQYFEHVSPNGIQPWFFAEEIGYNYKNFGENLAEGFFSADSTHESWMKSSGHRDNILSEEFEEVGVAIFGFEQNGLQSFLIIHHFGTQFEPEESLVITCSLKLRDHCRDAEIKKSEVKDSIKEQEELIKKLKKENASNEVIGKKEENIKKLNKIKEDMKNYIDQCENFIDKCEEWE